MNDFNITIPIEAPPERVWAIMSAVEQWPEWTPSVRSIKRLDSGPLAVGSWARIRQPKLPPAVWKVTELNPGVGFTWTTRGLGVLVTARHLVIASERGSLVTLSLQFTGIFATVTARITRKLNNYYLNLEATGLKRRSESSP